VIGGRIARAVAEREDPSPIELEGTPGDFQPSRDDRPIIPEPLPVRLIAVEDVRLPAPADVEEQLDAFYVGLLEFERTADAAAAGEIAYRSENFTLRFDVIPGIAIVRESLRPLGVEVLSLSGTERKLLDRELEYVRQRGVTPGTESLLLLDPAGNWVEISQARRVG
jgi:hypothetical protein